MTNEIRYDHMTDTTLIDAESRAALHALSGRWVRKAVALRTLQRALRRAADLRRSWTAMASLRAQHDPFQLVRRARSAFSAATTPLTVISVY